MCEAARRAPGATGEPMRATKQIRGATYIAVLLFLAITTALLGTTATVWSKERARTREAELLWIGMEFREAIGRYYENSPGSVKIYPPSLEALIEDRRYLSLKRYLRRVYPDPMTREARWGLVRGPDGGIMGVHSLSEARPIKRAGFPIVLRRFESATSYREWVFAYVPLTAGTAGGTAAPRLLGR